MTVSVYAAIMFAIPTGPGDHYEPADDVRRRGHPGRVRLLVACLGLLASAIGSFYVFRRTRRISSRRSSPPYMAVGRAWLFIVSCRLTSNEACRIAVCMAGGPL